MPKPKTFALADLSMDDKSQLLSRALEKEIGRYNCYVRDIFDAWLVYYDYDDGATYRCDYAIADDFSVTFGDSVEVIERSVYEPVKMGAFSLATAQNAGPVNVYSNSLLFEIQSDSEHFPGQGITVTKQDLSDIVSGFSGATMGLEHMDTVLGDACGDIRSMWLDSTGRRLFGDVAIPKGLDALIPPGPRRVSVEIYRDTAGKMSIPKVDLVLTPQIGKAALMSLAAFARNPQQYRTQETTPPMPTQNQATATETTDENKTGKPSLWDRFKAFCKDAGIPDEEPAHFSDPTVAEFRRKALLHDATFAKRKDAAKANAVIGMDATEAARFASLVDAAPEGIVFEDLETRAQTAARAKAPEAGRSRTTTATAFGASAQNADQAPPAETPQLETVAATFARRAQEASGGKR